jgi:uncharacterized protein
VAPKEDRLDYLELGAKDMQRSKAFYAEVFGWAFNDYGDDYADVQLGHMACGITTMRKIASKGTGPLVVFYARDLSGTEARIQAAGGKIVTKTFAFPGGRRFHFKDPAGNELAVWSDPESASGACG